MGKRLEGGLVHSVTAFGLLEAPLSLQHFSLPSTIFMRILSRVNAPELRGPAVMESLPPPYGSKYPWVCESRDPQLCLGAGTVWAGHC